MFSVLSLLFSASPCHNLAIPPAFHTFVLQLAQFFVSFCTAKVGQAKVAHW